MGIFATRTRPGDPGGTEAREMSLRFEAVGDALASGSSPVDACTVVGQGLAQDGISLAEALDGLRATYRRFRRGDPDYVATQAVAVAWSEATLGYLHTLSCEDPMTGLASHAHLRSRLTEVYRARGHGHPEVRDTHALVMLDAPWGPDGGPGDVLTHAFRAHRLGVAARTVFAGGETVARLGSSRVVTLASRDGHLGQRVGLLKRLLVGSAGVGDGVRVWIEGLPGDDDAAALLLDELTRH
ncbi:hypothetical protein NLS1_02870 [Nocardioides sp. LS1]|nr:hypothetical protein NLS1_02870 [Nocardioides sp. LS1]